MGFLTAEPFLWGPINVGRCSFCLRMHKVCSVSAQHGRFLEAVCRVTSVQWFLSFDGGELRMSSQPQRCSLWWSCHPPPAGCLAGHAAAVSQLATPPALSPALGEALMAPGRGEQEQQCRRYLCAVRGSQFLARS